MRNQREIVPATISYQKNYDIHLLKILSYFLGEVPTSLGSLRKQEKERKMFVHFWLDGRWYRCTYQKILGYFWVDGEDVPTRLDSLRQQEKVRKVFVHFLLGWEVVQKFLKNDLRILEYRLCVDFNIDFSAKMQADFHLQHQAFSSCSDLMLYDCYC